MASQGDLLDYVDWSCVECLNADPAHGLANVLKQASVCCGRSSKDLCAALPLIGAVPMPDPLLT